MSDLASEAYGSTADPNALLVNADAVRAFLAMHVAGDWTSAPLEFLSGGVSSAVVRVRMGSSCFVIKQALPQLRVEARWLSRRERSGVEARCAAVLEEITPGSVPHVILVVPEAHAFIMECAPPDAELWKARLMRGEIDLAIARAAGDLLGRIHAATAQSPVLAADFADRSFLDELRVEPYFGHTARLHPELRKEIRELTARLREPGRCLVHGDYSPKNLLVASGERLILLDHEVAHWGQPAFDVSFALTHLCLKAVHFRMKAYIDAATAFLDAYCQRSTLSDEAAGHLGGALLGGLLLARVDGKSPVEYLTDAERALIRRLAASILRDQAADPAKVLRDVAEVVGDG